MVRGSKHRRTFLALATGSVTAGLAGCFGGGGNGNGDSDGNGADENNSSDQDPEEQVPDADETVLVGPEGDFVFEPDSLEIDPGTTVGFVWESDGHNILTENVPGDAEWEGERSTEDTGHTLTHTFEVEGVYEYRCGRHQFQGMEGEVIVGDVDTGGNGTGNETDGTGNETDGTGNETDGTGNETDGSGNETDGTGNETDGTGNETDGSGNETDGSGDGGNESADGE